MKTSFKMSLVAAALFGSAFGASAATVAGLNQSVTAEWLKVARSTGASPATAANFVQTPAATDVVTVTLGAEYAVGDQGESMNAHYFAIATPTPASNTISK